MDLFGVIAISFISIVTIIYAFFKYSFYYWTLRGISHDEPSFPYGNLKNLGVVVHISDLMKNIYDRHKLSGSKVCGLYMFVKPVTILLDLDLVKAVLIRDFVYFDDRGTYYNEEDDPLSAHLFALSGEKWRKLRSKLSPTFTSGKMKFMFPTMIELGERFRDHLLEAIQQCNELDMKDLSARFTTDVIGTCAFGIECNSLKDPNADFRHYGGKIFGAPRHSPIFALFIEAFKDISRKLHVKRLADDVANFFMSAIRETVEYREANNIRRNDFMDILINLKNQETTDADKSITFHELAAQAYVFFLGGFGSLSTALTFCLYELAINPDVQVKARQIIRAALEEHNGQFAYEMMMDMTYIDQILQETIRKWPSQSYLTRIANRNYRFTGTDIVIEKGMSVFIPVYAIQNDPEYYPNPQKFDPDRFDSEEKKKRDPMTWLGFGDGPRNCIALSYAMLQSRIGLVTLLNSFEFSLGDKMQVPLTINKRAFVTEPEGSVYLKLKPV